MNGQAYVVFTGRCTECGDEWRERHEPIICPECHSREVVTVTAEQVPSTIPTTEGATRAR